MNPHIRPVKLSASIVLSQTPPGLIQGVIQSLAKAGLPIELHLIDNSPRPCVDPTAFPGACYEFVGENRGYGAGHNIAIRKIFDTSTYHFVLNPDISFEAPTIPAIIQFMESDPTIGQVMPKIIYPNGEIQYLCKLIPTPIDLLARKFLPGFLKPLIEPQLHRFELRASGYDSIMDVPYLSGCFMALRVKALRDIGLFDERYFMYPEVIDLTRRMAESYRTTYFPAVHVIHDHARESYKSYRMLWIHLENLIRYFNKWGWTFDKKRKTINNKTLKAVAKLAALNNAKI